MLQQQQRGIPVVDSSGSLVGLVTEADLVTKHARIHVPTYLGILGGIIPLERRHSDEEIRRALAVCAEELMETDIVTVGPDDDVDQAATLMIEEDADPIPVVENKKLIGLVGRADVIRLLLIEEETSEPAPQP
jgi:CBS domain-containing protein